MQPHTKPGRVAGWAFALLFVLALGQHVLYSLLAEQRDAGELLLTARDLLAGRLAYEHSYITKPPGAAYLIAAALAVSGQSLLAVRALVLVTNLLSALGVGLLCRSLGWAARTALLASLLFLFAAPQFEGAQVLTEPFLDACAVFGLWAFVEGRRRRSLPWLALAGALCGAAAWMKQVGVVVLAPPVLAAAVAFVRQRQDRRWLALAVIVLFAGWAGALGALAALAVRPANLEPFWRCVVVGPLTRPSDVWGDLHLRLLRRLRELPGVWLPAFLLAALAPVRLLTRRGAANTEGATFFLTAAVLFSLLPVLHRPYPHYFLPALPFAAILAAVWWQAAAARLLVPRRPLPAAAFALLLGLALYPAGAALAGTLRDLEAGATVFDDFRAGAELRAATEGRPALIVPAEAQFYFLSDIDPVSPHLFFAEESLRLMSPRPGLSREELVRTILLDILHDRRVAYVLLFGYWDDWERLPPEERSAWLLQTEVDAWTYDTRQYTLTRVRVLRRQSAP
jgi:4-amino-4-deoxy-L-arabinose transferase-like glycosyltransferase